MSRRTQLHSSQHKRCPFRNHNRLRKLASTHPDASETTCGTFKNDTVVDVIMTGAGVVASRDAEDSESSSDSSSEDEAGVSVTFDRKSVTSYFTSGEEGKRYKAYAVKRHPILADKGGRMYVTRLTISQHTHKFNPAAPLVF